MTHYLLIPIGSHGDVHPFIGLGVTLRQRGHRVTVATNGHFEGLAKKAGLDFIAISPEAEFLEHLKNPDLWSVKNGFKTVMEIGALPFMRQVYDLIESEMKKGPLVVGAHALAFGSRMAQDKLGAKVATIQLSPAVFRSVYENPTLPGLWMPQSMPKWMKGAFWAMGDAMIIEPIVRKPVNEFRASIGLGPIKGILKSWWMSPELVIGMFPEWFARTQPDWPRNTKLTGFPLYDERGLEPLAAELVDFLNAGEAPIAFTPGSAMTHGKDFFQASTDACVKLGRRGLLLTRHGEQIPKNLPAIVRHVPYAPFSELLPRAAALVHHGGIGTTAQALRSGCPQLIMPLAHDQLDNAARVEKLGCGLTLFPKKYRTDAVAGCLRELLESPRIASGTKEIASRFVNVDALAQACDLLEGLALEPGLVTSVTSSSREAPERTGH